MNLEEMRAVLGITYCPTCEQDCLPLPLGICGFCDTQVTEPEPGAKEPEPDPDHRKYGRRWTPEYIIDAMQIWEQRHGQPPSQSDWCGRNKGLWPSPATVRRAFGTWAAGIEAAGFKGLQQGEHRRAA